MIDDKINYREHEYDFTDEPHVASSTDCTGLIQIPPQNQDEFQSYQELSNMQFPKQDDVVITEQPYAEEAKFNGQ